MINLVLFISLLLFESHSLLEKKEKKRNEKERSHGIQDNCNFFFE